jgi:hypothetical protein
VKAAGNSNSPGTSVVLRARREGLAGVGERGIGAIGLPRNLGGLVVSDDVEGRGRYCGAKGQPMRSGKVDEES